MPNRSELEYFMIGLRYPFQIPGMYNEITPGIQSATIEDWLNVMTEIGTDISKFKWEYIDHEINKNV